MKKIQPTGNDLNDLLQNNREIFHQSRNVDSLKQHWQFLRELRLLVDQQNETTIDDISESFEEKERKMNDKEIIQNVNLNVEIEEGLLFLIIHFCSSPP